MATRVEGIARERLVALAGLVLGPVLLVAALAITMDTDALARLVPLERAWIQGVITIPLLLLAPAALGLAWSDATFEAAAKWLSRAMAIAIALGIVAWFATNLTTYLCQPMTPILTLRVGLPLGVIAGLGFFGAVGAGRWFASSERPRAAIVAAVLTFAAAMVAELALGVLLFPGVSCAYVPAPA